MKKKLSTKLFEEAAEEENDLASLGKERLAIRQVRVEKFAKWHEDLLNSSNVISVTEFSAQGKFEIKTNTEHGIIDYFPKANKILIRKENDWKEKGLHWLIKNILEV